jgi:hypothetical protein
VISRLLLVSALALVLVSTALGAGSAHSAQALPSRGILTPGVSLGGVHIGDTMTQVVARWGHNYKLCPTNQCGKKDTVWYYIYGRGEPLGAAVRFLNGKVRAVFTLGSPAGWHTAEGLLIGEQIDKANALYGQLGWSVCIGYGAMSMRNSKTVTSIYTTGEAVYGFALTAPGTPICQ